MDREDVPPIENDVAIEIINESGEEVLIDHLEHKFITANLEFHGGLKMRMWLKEA